MARNDGKTISNAIHRLNDVAVLELVGQMATEYDNYLKRVEAEPAGAAKAVGTFAQHFRQQLVAATQPAVSGE